MVVKNSAKLTLSRGKVSVKALIYDIVVLLVLLAIMVAVLIPAFSDVAEEIGSLKIGDKVIAVLENYDEGEAIRNEAIMDLGNTLQEALHRFINKFLVHSLIIIFLTSVLMRVMFGLKTLPVMDVVNSFMSTNSEYDFASNFVHNLKRSFKYSLAHSLVCIPFDALLVVYLMFGMVPTIRLLGITGPAVVVAVICLIFALRRIFLSNWVPDMLVNGNKVWAALKFSVKEGAKNFITYLWQFFAYAVIVWSVVVALGVSSFGLAAIVLFPVVTLYSKVYDLVDYYERNGLRYYAERGDVVVPEGAQQSEGKESV